MSQVTVNLPNTLYSQLETLAQSEGVSLHEYIVYTLTYQVKSTYNVQTLPEDAITDQQRNFSDLLKHLGKASTSEIQEVLEEREVVEPEEGLNQETMRRLRAKLS